MYVIWLLLKQSISCVDEIQVTAMVLLIAVLLSLQMYLDSAFYNPRHFKEASQKLLMSVMP